MNEELFVPTIYRFEGEEFYTNFIETVQMSNTNKLQRILQYGRTSLKNYDLIHTGGHAPRHIPISKCSRIRNPNIRHIHSFRVDVNPDSNFQTDRRQQLAEMADMTTAVSKHTATTVKQEFGFDPIVIYNGVDTDLFHSNYEKPPLLSRLDKNDPVFMFVGSLDSRKRPSDIIKVARQVPEATFLLIGDGPLYENLIAESRDLENVHLTGRIDKKRLPAIYANATGFLFPTIREGCPNVVLEAMASGLPVVGYETTSMPELVTTGKTGYLASPCDVNQLAEHVRSICENSDVTAMGEQARNYIEENHTFENIAAQYESLYLELLE
ncbi:glycosyltransferase family 4 protein [Halococcus thailandensis]|uniref:glycosyltransferase family 4 protein n=1 Tax=Halococcus thailandensis TaxID=335952 RepID=UPI001375A590|nr:glycosyltransferase family 4 protein [Halococcus thailandensis]